MYILFQGGYKEEQLDLLIIQQFENLRLLRIYLIHCRKNIKHSHVVIKKKLRSYVFVRMLRK